MKRKIKKRFDAFLEGFATVVSFGEFFTYDAAKLDHFEFEKSVGDALEEDRAQLASDAFSVRSDIYSNLDHAVNP